MTNVAVLGTIGVGKSTLIRRLKQTFLDQEESTVIEVVSEPSISLPSLHAVLEKFYKDTTSWAYPLQLGVSAAHEIHFQEMRKKEYDILLFDAPYSSFEYCHIHTKAGRMTEEERQAIENVSRPFPFDIVIMVQEDPDITIKRIVKRNHEVNSGKGIPDLDIADFDYLEEHIRDFREFQDEYIKKYFSNAKIILLEHLPDDDTKEYHDLLWELTQKIKE